MPRARFKTTAPFYLALLFLALSLLIALAASKAFYSLYRQSREDALDRRLFTIAAVAEPLLAEKAEVLMLAMEGASQKTALPQNEADWKNWLAYLRHQDPDYAELQLLIRGLADHAELHAVELLSRDGIILAEGSGKKMPGQGADFVDIDRIAWEPALQGQAASIPFYEYQGIPHKRIYAPVRLRNPESLQGKTGAVLRLEAGLDAARELTFLKKRGRFILLCVTLLMAAVVFLFYRQIRRLLKIEATTAHRDRLEAMGLLTAGIAHEIRNPLGIIRALTETLRDGLPETEKEIAGDILDEVTRLNQLVNQYLQFARPDNQEGRFSTDPSPVIEEALTLMKKSDGGQHIEMSLAEKLPPVGLSETALKQILLNLLLNAREASPPEGTIRLQARPLSGGKALEIAVSDEGPGIAPRDRKRLFEPFYTTKPQGSGLGLAISRRLARDGGGDIDVESAPEKGATFRLTLPAPRKGS